VNLYLRVGPTAQSRRQDKASTISLKEAAQSVPKSARKAFEQARAFRSKNRSDRALECLNRAVEIFPQYFQAFAERGHLRISMMQPAEAAADFARALELNDRYEPALRGSGICSFQEGKLEDAIVYFERAVSEAPSNAVDRLFLGICNARLDRPDVARAALHKALAIDPIGAARAHVYLAHLSIKENQPQDAIAELEAYLAALPDAPDADSQRSLILRLRRLLRESQKPSVKPEA
jgi:tetratricopeptide (TPR) repeat protein